MSLLLTVLTSAITTVVILSFVGLYLCDLLVSLVNDEIDGEDVG